MDGFGKFNIQGADPAGTGGIGSAITFTLNGLITNFTSNTGGNEFAVHVRYGGSCSGFIGGQVGVGTQGSNTNCTPQIPEPSSLLLFGSGLLGLAGVIRRRLSL